MLLIGIQRKFQICENGLEIVFIWAMPRQCPNPHCAAAPDSGRIVRYGSFFRKSDSKQITRFLCRTCHTHFSSATFSPCFGQKKRRINAPLRQLLCSGVSQRRAAWILKVNRKTVARKFLFLAAQAREKQKKLWATWIRNGTLFNSVQFDDLETSEHSKCKPLSVTLAVETDTRKILDFQVSVMPAKGKLAKIARTKYGRRPDERSSGWKQLFENLQLFVSPCATFVSDENPHYPIYLRRAFLSAHHQTAKGRRGCVVGQGELKRGGFDPLFSLNHTCAMLRANINRLFRRTWCTTKKRERLADHIALYVGFHNSVLTAF